MCGVQGLSEPLGALIALLFIKPFLTPLLLQYMLAFVGGIMARSLPSLSTVVHKPFLLPELLQHMLAFMAASLRIPSLPPSTWPFCCSAQGLPMLGAQVVRTKYVVLVQSCFPAYVMQVAGEEAPTTVIRV